MIWEVAKIEIEPQGKLIVTSITLAAFFVVFCRKPVFLGAKLQVFFISILI
jgi:hypothetical protein